MGYDISLSPPYGVLLGLAYASFFVVVVFAWRLIPGTVRYSRNDPRVIKQRFASVSLSVVVSIYSLYLLSSPTDKDESFLRFIGLHVDISAIISCSLLVAILFLGPLCDALLSSTLHLPQLMGISEEDRWIALRMYLIAPVSEEVVFRGCIGKVLVAQGCAFSTVIWFGPALFSIAHIRDMIPLVQMCLRKQRVPLNCILQLVVPLAFKQIFGMLSMFLFLRTGSVLAAICAHSFCNHMGFPSLDFMKFRGVNDQIVGACYAIGIVSFFFLLWPLTDV